MPSTSTEFPVGAGARATGVDLRGYKQLRLVVSVGLAGGLANFLRQTKGSLKSKIPFYIGGEECFCSREWTAPPLQGNFGALDRRALEEADVTVTFAEGPAIVAEIEASSTTCGFWRFRSRPTRAWHRAHPVTATPITWPMAKVAPAAAKPTSN